MKDFRDQRALVTGASSGLGSEFAKQLAAAGADLVLVARREDRLQELAAALGQDHRVDVRVIAMDLSTPEAGEKLEAQLAAEGTQVDILVNNAGFGLYGPFLEIPWVRERQMLELDIVTLTDLTKRFVRGMVERDRGWILQVASIGAYQPSPTYAAYSAAKSYVLSFGEALAYELRKTNVKISVLSPGVTRTEFLEVSGQEPTLYRRVMMMTSDDVVRAGLAALHRGKPSPIPGVGNCLAAWSLRVRPRRLGPAIAYWAMNVGND
jgi:short-subunit dehydrogenase